jgi:hypothetical protein
MRVPKRALEVATFFRHLYFSVAETMPHTLEMFEDGVKESLAEIADKLLLDLLDAWHSTALEQATLVHPGKLARRHLPPGRLHDLYMAYVATCVANHVQAASAETFRTVWRSGWDSILVFRKSSCHAQCKTCHVLKTTMRHADTIEVHADASIKLVTHLHAQWCDRQIYWSLRSSSCCKRDILTMIVDGSEAPLNYPCPALGPGLTRATKLRTLPKSITITVPSAELLLE